MGRMKKEDGTIAETQEDLEHTLNTFFTNILEEPDWDRVEAQREVMRHIPKVITEEHNFMLMKPIEMEEFEASFKQMVNNKSLGHDGFITNFFHTYWDWMKEEVWALVEDSRKTRIILKVLNSTFLMLIPKENGTKDPRNLRPIALLIVIYNIISKVIENRL